MPVPPVFRKRQAAPEPVDEDISADLIASLPEVDSSSRSKEAGANPFAPFAPTLEAPKPEDWRPTPAPKNAAHPGGRRNAGPAAGPVAEPDVTALVADVRRQMETVFSRELGKVEDGFTSALRQLEGRLDKANAELEGLRRENESLLRMKAEYDRKAEALKELARSFDRS